MLYPVLIVDNEGSTWTQTSNGLFWCGDNPTNEQGGYTYSEVEAKYGIASTI